MQINQIKIQFIVKHNSNTYQHSLNTKSQYTDKKFRHNQICHENYLLSGICTFKAPSETKVIKG